MTPVALRDARDERIYGGKAAQLARCLVESLPVPDGYALSTELVTAVVQGEPDALAALEAAFDHLGAPVAVRSSAVGEDGAQASFAGQHATVLNVIDRPGLREAVVAVAASGSSDGARAYRKSRGIAGDAHVGVVVQRLVPAECSGVLFTRDPASGERAILIEAAWGLGEAVVQGLVVPERYRLAPDGRLLERVAGELDVAVVPKGGGGTEEVACDATERRTLDERRLASLASLVRRCDAVFGPEPGHDIEWAFARGAGDAVLLQRRPITTRGGNR
jgi:pyruvate,water dikinase